MVKLVGRDAELAALRADLERAAAGRGSLVLISGEAGIGKTALAEAATDLARSTSLTVAWGRCLEDTGTPPYWPWSQVERALGIELGPPRSADSQEARFAYYEEHARELIARAALIVLDDLQWADEPSLVFLRFLAGELPESRLVLLGCFRTGELAALPALLRERSVRHVGLGGVGPAEVRELGAAEHAAEIHARSDGNPFFAIELVRALQAGGDVARLPETVRQAVRGRLERLPAASRSLLDAAAVIGRDFDAALLAAVVEEEPAAVLAGLEPVLAARLATESAGVYRFQHDLVREAIYEQLPPARRVALHERAGSELEGRLGANAERQLAALAQHFFRAAPGGGAARAVEYAARAAEFAMANCAFEEAARLYGLALEALAPASADRRRVELLLAQARALDLADRGAAAIATALEGSRAAERLGDAELAGALALVGEGSFTVDPEAGRVADICERALGLVDASRPALRSRVLAQLSVALHFREAERRGDLAAEALALAEACGDSAALSSALHAQQLAPWGSSTALDRLQRGDRLLSLGRESRLRQAELWGHFWRLSAFFEIGDVPSLDAEIETYGRVATEMHDPTARWRTALARGARRQMTGDFAEAEECATEVRATGMGAQNPAVQVMRNALMAAIRRTQGHYAEVVELTDEGMRIGPNPTLGWIRVAALAQLRAPSAEAEFARLSAGRVGLAARPHTWPIILMNFAETAVLLGATAEAERAYRWLLPYPDRNAVAAAGTAASGGSISRYLGLLAGFLGRLDDAATHQRFAIAMNGRQGALPFAAFSEYELAQVLLQRAATGDRAEALSLLVSALSRAERLGMVGLRADAAAALERVRGRAAAFAPLSPREAEVAALVAGGLTNREISQRLHLSIRTAENHVENICNKLGFGSRAQIAAWAADRGITS